MLAIAAQTPLSFMAAFNKAPAPKKAPEFCYGLPGPGEVPPALLRRQRPGHRSDPAAPGLALGCHDGWHWRGRVLPHPDWLAGARRGEVEGVVGPQAGLLPGRPQVRPALACPGGAG